MADDTAPFILTLTLDATSQARFDALRSAHFPPDRLVVGAHVTLFHALPSELGLAAVGREAAGLQAFPVAVSRVRRLGGGVAFDLQSVPLRSLRERLRGEWAAWLTPQDRQHWQPHVTVQNKVAPAAARALHQALSAGFAPYVVTATGLALWRYRGGPWEEAGYFSFDANRKAEAVSPFLTVS